MKENKYILNKLNDYEKTYETGNTGALNKYEFGQGAECSVYIPKDVNQNTKIMVYYPGINEKEDLYNKNGNLCIQNYLETQGNDTIVIMPSVNNRNNLERTELAVEMIEKIQEEYNLTSTDIEYSGWSLGADSCLLTAKKYIENNPNSQPQVCVTIDGYANYAYHPEKIISEIKEPFIQNGTILIGLEAPWRDRQNLDLYAKAGINVLKVVYKGDAEMDMIKNGKYYTWKNPNGYHTIVNQHFFKDNFSDFTSGKSTLPTSEYVYQRYDVESGKWIDIDPSLINTYDKLNTFFGNDVFQININKLKELNTINVTNLSITSDSNILLNHINSIIGNIKNSTFIQGEKNYNASFTSTTKIPSSIPGSVQKFYSTTATLLLKIANEVQEYAKIGESFDKKDKELEQEIIELNGPTDKELVVNNLNNKSVIANTLTTNKIIETLSETTKNKDAKKEEIPSKETETKKEDKKETTTTENKTNNEESKSKTEEPLNIETSNNNSDNNYYQNNNNQNSTLLNNNSHKQNQLPPMTTEKTNTIDDFPDYKEVYSDENRIVYDYKNEYRIIIHKDGDKITGIEHYYKFDNEILADKGLEILSETYKENKNIDNIIQKGNYVKVIFKEEVYTNMKLEDLRNKYKDLNEIVKL